MAKGGKIAVALALVIFWSSAAFAASGVISPTNETFVQFITTQAGTSTSVTSSGPMMVQNCNATGTSFDPVSSEVSIDSNDLPLQVVYFEWTGGAGYENLIGNCAVTSGSTTQSFTFYIPIAFATTTKSQGGANVPVVTAQFVTDTSTIPSICDFNENVGVINSQTPSVSTNVENLQVYALANPSSTLSADQIPAVGIDIQGFYDGFTVDNFSPSDNGCCGGAPFLIRVMCSTLAHFQTNS